MIRTRGGRVTSLSPLTGSVAAVLPSFIGPRHQHCPPARWSYGYDVVNLGIKFCGNSLAPLFAVPSLECRLLREE